MGVEIIKDESYFKMLAANFDPNTTTLKDTEGRETVLLVDTGACWTWLDNVWYEQ